MRSLNLILFFVFIFTVNISHAQDYTYDNRIEGIALIQTVAGQCDFEIDPKGFEEFLMSENLLDPSALAAVYQNAQLQSLMIGQNGGPSIMLCTQAKATGKIMGIIAE